MKNIVFLLMFVSPSYAGQSNSDIYNIIDSIGLVDITIHEKKWYLVGSNLASFDILKVQDAIFEYVKSHSDVTLMPSEEYLYQYKYLDEHTIHIQGVCFGLPDTYDLETSFVSFFDGGSCVFNIKLDLHTNKFYDFFINGYA